eukprot:527291_1
MTQQSQMTAAIQQIMDLNITFGQSLPSQLSLLARVYNCVQFNKDEKLILLLNYSVQLLARVYNCVQYRKTPIVAQLPDKLIDALSSKTPNPITNANKIGSQIIYAKASSLMKETKFCYDIISDVLVFQHEVTTVLSSVVNYRGNGIFDA